jgi:hypothetical protein
MIHIFIVIYTYLFLSRLGDSSKSNIFIFYILYSNDLYLIQSVAGGFEANLPVPFIFFPHQPSHKTDQYKNMCLFEQHLKIINSNKTNII